MFESFEDKNVMDVANDLTYQNYSKLFKTILKFRFYGEIKEIMQ